MTTVATAAVRVTASGSGSVVGELKKVNASLEKMAANSARVSAGASSAGAGLTKMGAAAAVAIGNLAADAIKASARAIGNLAESAFNAVGSFEAMEKQLTALQAQELKASGAFDSVADAMEEAGKRAKELTNWLKEMAIETPFGEQALGNLLAYAQGMGFATDEAKRLVQATADWAAATGKSEAAMESVIRALGQMAAKGKVSRQEINQLAEAGVNAMQILSDQMGKSVQEISDMLDKGEISVEEFTEAIMRGMEEDFAGAAKDATQSLLGVADALKDIAAVGLRALATPFFEALLPSAQSFVDLLRSEGIPALEKLGEKLGKAAQAAIAFGTVLLNAIQGKQLGSQLQTLIDLFPQFESKIKDVARALVRMRDVIADGGTAMDAFAALFPVLARNIEVGQENLQALRAAFQNLGPVLQRAGEVLRSVIKEIAAETIPQILDNMATAFENLGLRSKTAIEGIGPLLISLGARLIGLAAGIGAAGAVIGTGIMAAIEQAFQGDVSGAMETLRASLTAGLDAILTGLGLDISAADVIGRISALFEGDSTPLMNAISNLFGEIDLNSVISNALAAANLNIGALLSDLINVEDLNLQEKLTTAAATIDIQSVLATAIPPGSIDLGAILLSAIKLPDIGSIIVSLLGATGLGNIFQEALGDAAAVELDVTAVDNATPTIMSVQSNVEAVPTMWETALSTVGSVNAVARANAVAAAVNAIPAFKRVVIEVVVTGDPIPPLQHGTPSFAGGVAVVGETGPELVMLPRGSRVEPSSQSRGILNRNTGGDGSGNTYNATFYVQASSFDDIVREARSRGYQLMPVG